MKVLLIILACHAGAFAFAFGLAGIIGLLDFEAPKKKEHTSLSVLDVLFTGGVFAMFADIAHNWPSRVAARRLLYVGLACGMAFVTLMIFIGGM